MRFESKHESESRLSDEVNALLSSGVCELASGCLPGGLRFPGDLDLAIARMAKAWEDRTGKEWQNDWDGLPFETAPPADCFGGSGLI